MLPSPTSDRGAHHSLLRLAKLSRQGHQQPNVTSSSGADDCSGGGAAPLLQGETVGDQRPWPPWIRSDSALDQTARLLASYHRIVQHYSPPKDMVWRENHTPPGPGVVIAHNDTAPDNAVWNGDQLVGFIDWDMAGPRHRDDDLVWTAFGNGL
jgi:thiamine kinase-like enzyme